MLRFAEPMFLWLFVLVPLAWLMAARLRLIAPLRRATIIVLRTLLLACVILALAQLEWRRQSRDLTVFYLLDRSESIPAPMQDWQVAQLASLSKRATARDLTGVIAFGGEPSIETSPVRGFDFEGALLSAVDGSGTNIAAAARLALAAFPSDTMRRIVLLSDGNENAGSLLEIARVAQNSSVPIDVVPVRYDRMNDVRLEKVVVPQQTTRDTPFEVKIFVHSDEETPGIVRLYESGDLIAEEEVTLRPGRNPPLTMTRRLAEPGFHTYTATVEAAGDLRPQNNRANAFTFLRGEPRVLLVEGGSMDSVRYLAAALRAENIRADLATAHDIPVSLDELQNYDSLILSNVPADAMSQAQMRMIERAVHDLGIGLVMIGGENAFGAGGYTDSPVEAALPVSMDIKQKKVLPNGALVIVLHTCEIPDGNAWAREITLASLNVLAAQDYFGVNYFGVGTGGWSSGWGEVWLWDPPIQQAGNKTAMRTRIKGVMPGDAPAFDPMLRMASEELRKINAQTKHIIVISDGDPSPPSQRTVESIRDQGITVSGICINPHVPANAESMRQMAYWGAGNFYYPQDFNELPRIFTKEATVVRRSLIREQAFSPRYGAPSEVLLGLGGLPDLDGYVLTSIKDLATEALSTEWEDPLLAHWQYGLGKSLAFTSDAKDKWASSWVGWGSFSKFWSQAIRWTLRDINPANYQVHTEVEGGTGRVTIDALDDAGNFLNFIGFEGTVIGPEFESIPVEIRQVAPGRYEGVFAAPRIGTYMLSMLADEGDESPRFLTGGVALSYSPEYETSAPAEEFLRRVADVSGGAYVTGEDLANYNPYIRNLPPARRPIPLWPSLLLAAALLLPADIFFRRVYLDWGAVTRRVMGWMGRRKVETEEYDSRMESLRSAKSRARRQKEDEQEERAARDDFRRRLEEKQGEGGSVFEKADEPASALRSRKHTQSVETDTPRRGTPGGGSMESLLEAKKRAQKRRKK